MTSTQLSKVRNEARVHPWYEAYYGFRPRPFASSAYAIGHFASTTCCIGITRKVDADLTATFQVSRSGASRRGEEVGEQPSASSSMPSREVTKMREMSCCLS